MIPTLNYSRFREFEICPASFDEIKFSELNTSLINLSFRLSFIYVIFFQILNKSTTILTASIFLLFFKL
jgi:hypothetical protein